MIARQRFNANFIKTLIFWTILSVQISGGYAQSGQLNVDDGESHSTFSNVTANFTMTLDSTKGYRFAWRFNESSICTAAVTSGPTLIPASLECDPTPYAVGSNEKYYATNSQISGDTPSGVITLELVYSMALLEEYPLRIDVYDTAANRLLSNIVYITVQNCTKNTDGLDISIVLEDLSTSCDYLCSASVVCANGYSSSDSTSDLKAICEDNNMWRLNGISPCKSITTTKTPTTSKTSTTSTPGPVTISPNDTRACIGGCLVTSSSNGSFELTCLDQRYNKKSSPATQNPDGVFIAEVVLYCIGYTEGYIAGITISVIGGLAIVVNAIIVGVAWSTVSAEDDKNKILLALGLGIASTVVWAVCIGLLFGLEEGNYDMNGGQITGCVLGSFACVGAIGSCAWSGKVMKQSSAEQKYRAKNGTSVEKEPGSQDVYAAVDKSKKTSQATNL